MNNYKTNNDLLTIAIPVYNGAQTIAETLDSIVYQIEDGVDVLISDNASTDNTRKIVLEYQKKYPAVKYYCNESNIGGENNLNKLFELSNGKYVWIVGDDDKLMEGGVKRVLDVLRNNINKKLSFIFVNLSMWSRDFTKCINDNFLKTENDLLIEDQNIFLNLLGANAAFTPCLVMHRKSWLDIKQTKFDGTGWLTLCKIYTALQNKNAYIIGYPYVQFRDGSLASHAEGRFYNQMLDLIILFETLSDMGYDNSVLQKKISEFKKSLPITIINQKYYGLKVNASLLKKSIIVNKNSPNFWFLGFPLLLTPKFIFNAVKELNEISAINMIIKNLYSIILSISSQKRI